MVFIAQYDHLLLPNICYSFIMPFRSLSEVLDLTLLLLWEIFRRKVDRRGQL